jgi:hypothetical protein
MVRTETRIQVTVEISGSCYGGEWTLNELTKQSGNEAISRLRAVLADNKVQIIGTPVVTAITSVSV